MTLRTIPPLLLADMQAGVGTFCLLLQIVATDGTVLGCADLDRPRVYDAGDGLGPVTYLPDPGYQANEIEFANDLSVDGTDGYALVPIGISPFKPEDIRAGKWDRAKFRALLVNYEALDHGHVEVLWGEIGDITIRRQTLLLVQLNGPTQPLQQNIVSLTSKTCRAVHGSKENEARWFCGYDFTNDWVSFTVTDVDPDDNARTFQSDDLMQETGYFFPGIVVWDTGDNAGTRQRGVADHAAGGVISLRMPLPRPVQIGDQARVRITCTKFVEGRRGCREFFGAQWGLHFQGEPDTDTVVNAQEPRARLSAGQGGATSVPIDEVEQQ